MGSGLIGTDPFDPQSWSGSSGFFFRECDRQGILKRAFGVEVDSVRRLPLMARNFSLKRDLWRQKFYLDTTYYGLLSKKIANALADDERDCAVLQLGGIYNLRPLLGKDRLIVSYHDGNLAQAIRNPQFPKGVPQRSLKRAMDYEREVYHNVDLILTMSDYLRRSFIDDFAVPEGRVKTIGAGINLVEFPQSGPKNYDSRQLLFVGADFERKGGRDLLHAFARVRNVIPDAKLTIIGPRQLSIPDELSGGVEFLGFLSKADPVERIRLDQAFNDASVFVMPSLYEPFGIAPLEAMAHGVCVVLTDRWAFPEMAYPGVTGELVQCNAPEQLASKLIDLLRRPDRLQVMGANGREMVAKRFTWDAVVTRLQTELNRMGWNRD